MRTPAEHTTGAAGEALTLLARMAEGRAAEAVVRQALAEPDVYVFGELMRLPGIAALAGGAPPVWTLLQIFAYGTLREYEAARAAGSVPEVSAAERSKLQALSLVSACAAASHGVAFDTIRTECGMPHASDREVQSFISRAALRTGVWTAGPLLAWVCC